MFEHTFFNGADAVTMFSSKRFSDVAQIALLCFFGYKSRDKCGNGHESSGKNAHSVKQLRRTLSDCFTIREPFWCQSFKDKKNISQFLL